MSSAESKMSHYPAESRSRRAAAPIRSEPDKATAVQPTGLQGRARQESAPSLGSKRAKFWLELGKTPAVAMMDVKSRRITRTRPPSALGHQCVPLFHAGALHVSLTGETHAIAC